MSGQVLRGAPGLGIPAPSPDDMVDLPASTYDRHPDECVTVEWTPHRYRDIHTGKMRTDPSIEHADNGRTRGEPGWLGVTVAPYTLGYQLIAMAESWPKGYFTRAWADRADARRVAEALLIHSLDVRADMPRHNLYKLIDCLAAAAAS